MMNKELNELKISFNNLVESAVRLNELYEKKCKSELELREENNRLNKEVEKYKKRCYEALTLIRKNYGLLDKYGIDMLDDILNGK